MSAKCKDCNCEQKEGEFAYMYREKSGVSVFTGFIQKDGDYKQIYWIGKDHTFVNSPLHINVENQAHINFFMKEMKQYDH
jgi:hypothetical protein